MADTVCQFTKQIICDRIICKDTRQYQIVLNSTLKHLENLIIQRKRYNTLLYNPLMVNNETEEL